MALCREEVTRGQRVEAAVAPKATGGLQRQPPLLGAVVRLLNLRGVAEQQERQSGQLPPAPIQGFRVPENPDEAAKK